ncbi:MAG TPA: hypothetical protein VNF47_05485 [Streptosporangiaceae bacterium]|nr:hypothetical protein [Streptosporangiaceae bacterium]
MDGALSSRRVLARRAATAAAAIAAMLLLASSASASVPARPAAGRSLQTLFGTVRVFARASSHASIRAKLKDAGTGVSVTCWTTGTDYKGMPIWYQISAPAAGYIPAFNVDAHFSPAAGVPHCLTPAFSAQFYSLEVNLRIRRRPSTGATITGYLVSVGSKVKVDCFVTGNPIFGDAIWYHSRYPAIGYVTGRFLNTGGDPAPGVPRC